MEGDEASSSENSSAEEGGHGEEASEYERQRLTIIRENKARLEALGLPQLASSILGPPSKAREGGRGQKKAKKKNKGGGGDGGDDEDDEEYVPPDEDVAEEEKDRESSSSGEEDEEGKKRSSGSRRKGKKRKSSNLSRVGKSSHVKRMMNESEGFVDDDEALQQAIALSLGEAKEVSTAVLSRHSQNYGTNAADSGPRGKKDQNNVQETAGKRKNRKGNKPRVQLTEDEVVAYFFSFDEVGKGHLTVWDLQRITNAHDFIWTESEIANMIHCFDSDGDGKLSLDDFRSIVSRCNMIQEPGEC